MAALFCNQCGHRNPPDSNFCSVCGAPLDVVRAERTITFHTREPGETAPEPDDDVVVNLADLPGGQGVLLVRSGPQAGLRVQLTKAVTTLGRSDDADVSLDDITVSRQHVEVVRTAEGFAVRDAGSLNGTYLNHERIDGSRPLVHGDELQVGKFKLVFLLGADAG